MSHSPREIPYEWLWSRTKHTTQCDTLHTLRRCLVRASLDFIERQRHRQRILVMLHSSELLGNRSSSRTLVIVRYSSSPFLWRASKLVLGFKLAPRIGLWTLFWAKTCIVTAAYPTGWHQHHPHQDLAMISCPSSVFLCSARTTLHLLLRVAGGDFGNKVSFWGTSSGSRCNWSFWKLS